jgi:hypothetical protein
LALFAFLAYDLAHHQAPYAPDKPRFHVDRLLMPVLWLAAGFGPWLIRSLRRRTTQSWPLTKSRIESASITMAPGRGGDIYLLTVGYSYAVNGETYGGVYTERFSTGSEAQAVLRSMRDVPPPKRYNPDDLLESVMDPYNDAVLSATH